MRFSEIESAVSSTTTNSPVSRLPSIARASGHLSSDIASLGGRVTSRSVPGPARTADVVFTAQQTLEEAKAFYAGLKARLAAHGRESHELAVMPGLLPIIGRTAKEAREKLDLLESWTNPNEVLPLHSERLGHDMSAFDLDGPVPPLPETEQLKSRQKLLIDLARRENLSIRQLAQRVATSRGHHVILRTALDVADEMQRWFEEGAADGFNIMPAYFPADYRTSPLRWFPFCKSAAFSGMIMRPILCEDISDGAGLPSPYTGR